MGIIDMEILKKAGISENDMRIELAIALYKRGKLSIGKASELAGLHKIEFQRELGVRGEVSNYDESDLEEDLEMLKKVGE